MKKRGNIADNPWTVQARAVAVPDAAARVRAAVGVLLAEIGDGPATVQGRVEAPAGTGASQPAE